MAFPRRASPRVASLAAWLGLACTLAAPLAHGQVGDTVDALPGIGALPTPTTAARTGFAIAGSAGYGYTEAVLGQGDGHQRVLGGLAASYQPASFFAAGLLLGGHYDFNSGPGAANGGVGTSKLELRFGVPLGGRLHLGAAVGVWFPGDTGVSFVPKATTPDVSVIAALDPDDSRFALAARAGFRLDNSAQAVPNASELPLAGRVSLGYDQADAVLLGLGGQARLTSRIAILLGARWDLLVGSGAPSALESPIVVEAGARFDLDDRGIVQALAMLDASPSARPPVTSTTPLVDIEPRAGAYVGIVLRPASSKRVPLAPPRPPETPIDAKAPIAPLVVTASSAVRGRVTDAEQALPLPNATVTVRPNTPFARRVTTDDAGHFEVTRLEPGIATVTISAAGFESVTREITLGAAPVEMEVAVPKALPIGQMRGLVRNFKGTPIRAEVRVEPTGQQVQTDAQGTFEFNVAPGTYEIVIRAPGYVEQRRRVAVERSGVTLLNAELRTAPRSDKVAR